MTEYKYTMNEYQADAMHFRLESAQDHMYAITGLAGEVGEVMSLIAKSIRDGRKFDHSLNMKKELGDVLWFVAAIAADHGYSLDDVASANIMKLTARQVNNTLQGSGDNR